MCTSSFLLHLLYTPESLADIHSSYCRIPRVKSKTSATAGPPLFSFLFGSFPFLFFPFPFLAPFLFLFSFSLSQHPAKIWYLKYPLFLVLKNEESRIL